MEGKKEKSIRINQSKVDNVVQEQSRSAGKGYETQSASIPVAEVVVAVQAD